LLLRDFRKMHFARPRFGDNLEINAAITVKITAYNLHHHDSMYHFISLFEEAHSCWDPPCIIDAVLIYHWDFYIDGYVFLFLFS